MTKNWWFKFEYRVWQSDPALSQCSLAARGFWLEILSAMYAQNVDTVTGSFEQIARMTRCESAEVAKCSLELKQANVCDVTLCHGNVTLVSRRLKRALSAKESNTLRKRKERGHANVTQQSKSNKKEVTEREEKNVRAASPPAHEIDAVDAHTLGYPLADLFKFFPSLTITPAQMGMIQVEVKDNPVDREAWTETIKHYVGNHDPATKSYLPQKVGNLLSVFKSKQKEVSNGTNKRNNTKRTDADVLAESADFYREWEAREAVNDLAN